MIPARARVIAAAVVAAAFIAVVVDAQAYWLATGTGTGSTATGSATAALLTPGVPDDALYPGGQSAVTTIASNPNTAAVTINSLALDPAQGTGGFAVDAGHAACGVSSLSFGTHNNAGAGWRVPAKVGNTDGTLAITLPNALAMTVDAADTCQGARFTVYLKAGS